MEAVRQWVSSPLSFNILLAALKQDGPNVMKYCQIANFFKQTKSCFLDTKLFVSSASKVKSSIASLVNISDVVQADFSKNANSFSTWVTRNGFLTENVARDVTPNTEFVLANVASFQDLDLGFKARVTRRRKYCHPCRTEHPSIAATPAAWHVKRPTSKLGVARPSIWSCYSACGPCMTVYNSYDYTQDVKYEGRLLEFPLESGFKLVVLVPSDVDVLQCLYNTLMLQGLSAAIRSIQPLFTVSCELNAPNINLSSRVEDLEKVFVIGNSSTVQYGNLLVNQAGTSAKVLSCLYSPTNPTMAKHCPRNVDQMFYVAVVFGDTPIFTGQFY